MLNQQTSSKATMNDIIDKYISRSNSSNFEALPPKRNSEVNITQSVILDKSTTLKKSNTANSKNTTSNNLP